MISWLFVIIIKKCEFVLWLTSRALVSCAVFDVDLYIVNLWLLLFLLLFLALFVFVYLPVSSLYKSLLFYVCLALDNDTPLCLVNDLHTYIKICLFGWLRVDKKSIIIRNLWINILWNRRNKRLEKGQQFWNM